MLAEFENYIKEEAKLSDEECILVSSLAIQRTLRRKEALLQEGEICRYKVFIAKGFLRTYGTREDGSEHIIKFSPENSWAVDPESYDNAKPTRYNIDALEYSEVLLWTKENFDSLFTRVPRLKTFVEKLISSNIYSSQQRVFSALSSTAEEKYDEFVQNYPNVFARVPLHMVASYLGVSRETLSRIRQAQLKK